MNKRKKHLVSLITVGFFIFLAFGSDKKSKNNDNANLSESQNGQIEQNLTQEQKDSIAIIKKENKTKAEKILKTFKKDTDEFEGSNFYRDPRAPKYTNENFIFPYIGQKDDQYWLRLKFQYASDSWLFINNAILMVDGEKYGISGNWERDNDQEIWEWLDITVEEREYNILKKIADSKNAKIRYEGNQYHDDRTITSKEKSIIKKTLEVYDLLK